MGILARTGRVLDRVLDFLLDPVAANGRALVEQLEGQLPMRTEEESRVLRDRFDAVVKEWRSASVEREQARNSMLLAQTRVLRSERAYQNARRPRTEMQKRATWMQDERKLKETAVAYELAKAREEGAMEALMSVFEECLTGPSGDPTRP